MKFGFIGAGNMGSAIFRGMIKSGYKKSEDIYIYDLNSEKLDIYSKELKINIASDYIDLISNSDVIILSVKPNVIKTVLEKVSNYIKEYKPLIVSIAAGITIKSIEEVIGNELPIIRVMPNINAEIGFSTTAYCGNDSSKENHKKIIKECFESVGYAIEIDESKFSIFAGIAGCSPAYVYLFIDSLARGAQKAGMDKKTALKIAANAVFGSAKMVIESNIHPHELIDKVCSPGGTTIEGICTLNEFNFEAGIVKAVENSIKKDSLLNN